MRWIEVLRECWARDYRSVPVSLRMPWSDVDRLCDHLDLAARVYEAEAKSSTDSAVRSAAKDFAADAGALALRIRRAAA